MRRIILGSALAMAGLLSGPAMAESLKSAVTAAVTNNPIAKAHSADVQASAMELLQRERDFLPTITADAYAGAGYYNDPARLAPANNNRVSIGATVGVTAEYVVFDGYRRANQVYQDAARVDGSIFRLLDASETLALNAVEAYVDVIRHRNLVSISQANVARHQDIVSQVLDLVDGGRRPTSDRFEAEQRLMAAKLALVQVREALANANARYEAVVGHKPGKQMSLPGVSGLPMQHDSFVARAIKANHRVKAADTGVQEAYYAQDIAKSGDLPQIKLQAGARAGTGMDGVPGTSLEGFAGVRAEWEIWSGGRDARDRGAALRTAQALAERDMAVRDVRELAMTTWNAYHANIERTVLLDRQLAATRRAADQYLTQFEAGTRTLLEVLEAERAWFSARFEDVSAEASYAFNQYQLLAVESRLARHFGVQNANVALLPDFESRATTQGAFQIFSTDIPDLE